MPIPMPGVILNANELARKRATERQIKKRDSRKRTLSEATRGWEESNRNAEIHNAEQIVLRMNELSLTE